MIRTSVLAALLLVLAGCTSSGPRPGEAEYYAAMRAQIEQPMFRLAVTPGQDLRISGLSSVEVFFPQQLKQYQAPASIGQQLASAAINVAPILAGQWFSYRQMGQAFESVTTLGLAGIGAAGQTLVVPQNNTEVVVVETPPVQVVNPPPAQVVNPIVIQQNP